MPVLVVCTLMVLLLIDGLAGVFSTAFALDRTSDEVASLTTPRFFEDVSLDDDESIDLAFSDPKRFQSVLSDGQKKSNRSPEPRRLPQSLFDKDLILLSSSVLSPDDGSPSSMPSAAASSNIPASHQIAPDSIAPQSSNPAYPSFARLSAVEQFFADFHGNKADFLSCNEEFAWYLGALGRGYYLDDQRYQFTGCEQSFGVQGVVEGGARHVQGDWIYTFDSQFFLNQPFDKSILTGLPFLNSFNANFQVDPFQISLLTLSARRNTLLVQAGRFVTPFGRFYYPIYQNSFWDSPFIRSDAILYRETGVLVQWDPQPFIVTAAITNGGFQQDTNSSKAFIGRIGLYGDSYAVGSSVKMQDGIGSEWQKECNSHIGVDAMYQWGPWNLSTEAIIDYYGMSHAGLNPDDITWGRSIYFRDANQFVAGPLTGYGYYVNLLRNWDRWLLNLNYGDYFPQKIGDPRQDTPIHRGLIKVTRHVTRHLDVFAVNLLENSVQISPGHMREGFGLLVGFQFML